MNQMKILEEFRNVVSIDSKKARNVIKKLEYKNDYYLLNCIAQTYLDESRFDEDDKLKIHIDKKKWRLAEKYCIRAYEINPENTEVLYTMGEIRKIFEDQVELAINCFEKIVNFDIKDIGVDEYGRGVDFAKELVNDSRFELYRLFYPTEKSLALRYLKEYEAELKKGTSSIFKPLKQYLLK